VELERTLLRKVGEAIHRFQMIRDGDRVAVALSGGKDSLTLLDALLLLAKRAPVEFSVCAFTVEQGKFLRPVEPLGDYLRGRGIAWTYFRDKPSLRLLEDQPDHGCDLCSRYRRRAVYEIARGLGANVIAFGHTADDFCEALLRNTMFTGKLSALPPVTHSRDREFRLIPPLAFAPSDCAYAVGMSSVTKTSGRMSRNSRSLECVTGGSALNFPVNMVLRSSASQKSSAVWPNAITLARRPRAISYTARRR